MDAAGPFFSVPALPVVNAALDGFDPLSSHEQEGLWIKDPQVGRDLLRPLAVPVRLDHLLHIKLPELLVDKPFLFPH